jgi:hypothetical protein
MDVLNEGEYVMSLVLILSLVVAVAVAWVIVLRVVSRIIPDSYSFWHELKSDPQVRHLLPSKHAVDSANISWPRL